jgi:hypothetical protein
MLDWWRLNELEELHISGTQITDAGLVHLHGFSKLKVVSAIETGVTFEGAMDLRKRFPTLSISVRVD